MEMKLIGSADAIYPSSGSENAEIWETIDGRRICVSDWNGEKWLECWEIAPDMSAGPSFEAAPIYRWEAEGMAVEDLKKLEENSPEWDRANEIVGLDF